MTTQSDSSETDRLLSQLAHGDASALGKLLTHHRDYIKRVVDLRIDQALRDRVDPSDVVQETQLTVSERIDDFVRRRPTSFRIWLRRETMEKLVDVRRRHLSQKRSVRRESRLSDASSVSIAQHLLSDRPSRVLQSKELAQQVRDAIQQLSEIDREVVLLRYVEQLTNAEVAELLKIDVGTAHKRHGRAIRRLGQQLAAVGVSGQDG